MNFLTKLKTWFANNELRTYTPQRMFVGQFPIDEQEFADTPDQASLSGPLESACKPDGDIGGTDAH
jgi:hypothetical protein